MWNTQKHSSRAITSPCLKSSKHIEHSFSSGAVSVSSVVCCVIVVLCYEREREREKVDSTNKSRTNMRCHMVCGCGCCCSCCGGGGVCLAVGILGIHFRQLFKELRVRCIVTIVDKLGVVYGIVIKIIPRVEFRVGFVVDWCGWWGWLLSLLSYHILMFVFNVLQ